MSIEQPGQYREPELSDTLLDIPTDNLVNKRKPRDPVLELGSQLSELYVSTQCPDEGETAVAGAQAEIYPAWDDVRKELYEISERVKLVEQNFSQSLHSNINREESLRQHIDDRFQGFESYVESALFQLEQSVTQCF